MRLFIKKGKLIRTYDNLTEDQVLLIVELLSENPWENMTLDEEAFWRRQGLSPTRDKYAAFWTTEDKR